MVFTYTIQVNTRKKGKKEKTQTKKSRNNGNTNKLPTSKVDKYLDWDKRMLGIRCGKATGKIFSESNQLYLKMILSVLDRNKIAPNLINR